MTYQRILLRLLSSPALSGVGRRFLHSRIWTIEAGEAAGLKLTFPQNRDYIFGSSEVPVQKVLGQRLRPGDVFYDIGSNMGFFSLIAGRLVGETGCVCAFEPYPPNAAAARQNARLNHLANFRLFEVAVGRNSRRDELLMTEWDGGGTLLKSVSGSFPVVDRTEVQVVAIDEFIATNQLPQPTFVKVDVEGAEFEVIEGMAKTIARWKPVLLFEIDDEDQHQFQLRWAELDDRVREYGYEVLHLEDSYPTLNWNVGHSLALPLTGC